jgi:hypothetical protein
MVLNDLGFGPSASPGLFLDKKNKRTTSQRGFTSCFRKQYQTLHGLYSCPLMAWGSCQMILLRKCFHQVRHWHRLVAKSRTTDYCECVLWYPVIFNIFWKHCQAQSQSSWTYGCVPCEDGEVATEDLEIMLRYMGCIFDRNLCDSLAVLRFLQAAMCIWWIGQTWEVQAAKESTKEVRRSSCFQVFLG